MYVAIENERVLVIEEAITEPSGPHSISEVTVVLGRPFMVQVIVTGSPGSGLGSGALISSTA